jgi:hypothetical protein
MYLVYVNVNVYFIVAVNVAASARTCPLLLLFKKTPRPPESEHNTRIWIVVTNHLLAYVTGKIPKAKKRRKSFSKRLDALAGNVEEKTQSFAT